MIAFFIGMVYFQVYKQSNAISVALFFLAIFITWIISYYIVQWYDKSRLIPLHILNLIDGYTQVEILRSRNRKELEPILHELELIFNSHRQGSPNLP